MTSHAVSATSETTTVEVELPTYALQLLGPTADEVALYLKKLALIELFRRGEVSSGWAAEKLGISKDDFPDLLAEHDMPYVGLSEEELREQVGAAMPRAGR